MADIGITSNDSPKHRNFPFSNTHQVTPFVQYDIMNQGWNYVPNEYITEFSVNNGLKGTLKLFDTYDGGRKNYSWVETFLAQIHSIEGFPIKFRFGWRGDNDVKSPVYSCSITDSRVSYTDGGLDTTISFIIGGLSFELLQGTFKDNIDSRFWKGKYSPFDLIKKILDKYNNPVIDGNVRPRSEYSKIKFGMTHCINCKELYEGGAGGKTEAIPEFSLAGKTLNQVLDDIVANFIKPKNVADSIAFKYFYKIERPTNDDNGPYNLWIYKINLADEKLVWRRDYFYRSGTRSSLLSLTVEERSAGAIYSQAINCNIEAVGYNSKTGELEKVKQPESCPKLKNTLLKGFNPNLFGPEKGKDWGEKLPGLKNNLIVNMANKDWGNSIGGQILLRNMYQTMALLLPSTITMTILGDPFYVLGLDATLRDSAPNQTTSERYHIGMADYVSLKIYNSNGKISWMSGIYIILSIEHRISEGDFVTIVKAVCKNADMFTTEMTPPTAIA